MILYNKYLTQSSLTIPKLFLLDLEQEEQGWAKFFEYFCMPKNLLGGFESCLQKFIIEAQNKKKYQNTLNKEETCLMRSFAGLLH